MKHNDFTLTPILSLEGRGGAALALLALITLIQISGCIRITINPQCPDEIEVDGTGELIANEANTGAIPTYLWEAEPAGRVAIADETRAETSFEALRSGEVTFTLTASDGLFQMIDTCTTTITAASEPEPEPEPEPDLSVTLVANPTVIIVGVNDPSTLLSCTNTGTTSAILTIDQLDGAPVEMTPVAPGISVAVFDEEIGAYTFRCLATDANGNRSDPATVQVTLANAPRPSPR